MTALPSGPPAVALVVTTRNRWGLGNTHLAAPDAAVLAACSPTQAVYGYPSSGDPEDLTCHRCRSLAHDAGLIGEVDLVAYVVWGSLRLPATRADALRRGLRPEPHLATTAAALVTSTLDAHPTHPTISVVETAAPSGDSVLTVTGSGRLPRDLPHRLAALSHHCDGVLTVHVVGHTSALTLSLTGGQVYGSLRAGRVIR